MSERINMYGGKRKIKQKKKKCGSHTNYQSCDAYATVSANTALLQY